MEFDKTRWSYPQNSDHNCAQKVGVGLEGGGSWVLVLGGLRVERPDGSWGWWVRRSGSDGVRVWWESIG